MGCALPGRFVVEEGRWTCLTLLKESYAPSSVRLLAFPGARESRAAEQKAMNFCFHWALISLIVRESLSPLWIHRIALRKKWRAYTIFAETQILSMHILRKGCAKDVAVYLSLKEKLCWKCTRSYSDTMSLHSFQCIQLRGPKLFSILVALVDWWLPPDFPTYRKKSFLLKLFWNWSAVSFKTLNGRQTTFY